MPRNNTQPNSFELTKAPPCVREAFERLHDAKRNTLQLCNLTTDALPPPPNQQKMQKDRDAVESIIEAMLQAKENELAAAELAVAFTNREWHKGNLVVERETFQSEIEKLERQVTALRGDTLVIRSSRHELSGRLLDNMMWRQDRERPDWAFLNLLISRYKKPEGARLSLFASTDTKAQRRFQKNIMTAYNAVYVDLQWCVISGKYHSEPTVKAVHIVKYNIGEPTACHLFGPSDDKDGHLMSAKNGLPMHYRYQEAFEDGHLVIIPDGDPQKGHWKVYCLDDPDTHKPSRMVPFGRELHGRSLQFQNDFRPATAYCYFAFCMGILRRQRHDYPRWWKDYFERDPDVMMVWGALRNYLRCSTLRTIARQVGHLPSGEEAIFAYERRSDRQSADDNEDRKMNVLHAKMIGCAYASQSSPTSGWDGETVETSETESSEGEDEEDDDEDDDEEEDDEDEGEDEDEEEDGEEYSYYDHVLTYL